MQHLPPAFKRSKFQKTFKFLNVAYSVVSDPTLQAARLIEFSVVCLTFPTYQRPTIFKCSRSIAMDGAQPRSLFWL